MYLYSGQIIHKALHAVAPETPGSRRGAAVPAEEFDFYKQILNFEDLFKVLLRMKTFNIDIFMQWRDKTQKRTAAAAAAATTPPAAAAAAASSKRRAYDAGIFKQVRGVAGGGRKKERTEY